CGEDRRRERRYARRPAPIPRGAARAALRRRVADQQTRLISSDCWLTCGAGYGREMVVPQGVFRRLTTGPRTIPSGEKATVEKRLGMFASDKRKSGHGRC